MRAATSVLALAMAPCLLVDCGGRTALDDATPCPPGRSACHGACVDEQNDDRNCGGCGAVCAAPSPSAASCALGRCLVTLASGDFADIAVGTEHVYWTTYGENAVMRIPIAGGTAVKLASGQNYPFGIATDATNLYWTNYDLDGAVMKMPVGGGTPTTLAAGQVYPARIAVHAGSVYWATRAGQGRNGTVMKAPVGGGAATPLAWGQHSPDALAIDATNVYWATGDDTVMKVPIGGGTATVLVSALGISGRLALDAHNVYSCASPGINWSDGGTVIKMPIGGGTPTILAASHPRLIAVDATSVYWTSPGLRTFAPLLSPTAPS